jgi:Mg-chelatase subunit ChlD
MTTEGATGPATRSLSDYWRIDRSSDRARELASILGGAATQSELVRARLRPARARDRGAGGAPLVLDPRLLSGFAAPVPAPVVDCVVGLAIRNAAQRELSIPASAWDEWPALDDFERREFTRVYRALEEVYVVSRLSRLSRTLAMYLEAAHDVLAPWSPRDAAPHGDVPLTRDSILELWLGVRLRGGLLPADLNPELLGAVAELEAQAREYVSIREPRRRLAQAGLVWRRLCAFPPGAGDAVMPWWMACQEATGESAEARADRLQMRKNVLGGAEAGSFVDLSQYTMDAAVMAPSGAGEAPEELRGAAVVLTNELRELGVRAAATAIKDARFDPDDYERVRAEVAQDIQSVRRLFARMDDARSRWRYGLRRGKLDGRGLTRIAAGKDSVFKRRDRHRGSTAMVFLIDVSASMKSHMPAVHRAACIVAEALRGLAPRVWYEVLTYTSGGLHPGAPVQLTRLASSAMPLSLRDVWCDGGTPTGEAIAAALLILRRRMAQRRLVLHFTDGHPKDTYVVRQALELCRGAGVDVLTVSVGAPQEGLYGAGKCEVAYTVSELPDVLARLLPRLYR